MSGPHSNMDLPSVLALVSLPLVYGGNFTSNENLAGQIIDGQLFRVVCALDSAENPQFSIKLTGRAADNSVLFQVTFTKGVSSGSYKMILAAGGLPTVLTSPGYNLLIDDDGIPQIPIVMGYGKGIFTCHSSGEGGYVNSSTQANNLEIVNVVASGLSLVDCTCVEIGKL